MARTRPPKGKSSATPKIHDVAIVGGGHAGLSLAAALGTAGLNVVCLDRALPATQTTSKFDGRTMAIAYAVQQELVKSGVWAHLEKDACPIHDIRVTDQNTPLALTFDHREVGQPLGWIIENRLLRVGLHQRLAELPNVTFMAPVEPEGMDIGPACATLRLKGGDGLRARLVAGADGRASPCRQWAGIGLKRRDYWQSAVVCTIAHTWPHHHMAIEHFLPGGPLALLPMTENRVSVVWSEHHDAAQALMQMSEKDFLARLAAHAGDMLGDMRLVGDRFCYPLTLMHAESYVAPRLALVGESAHAIHPIAGQGFNLSMRDIALLTKLLAEAHRLGLDIGGMDLLRRYERGRRFDNSSMAVVTDVLDRFFSNAVPGLGLLRRIGLATVQKLPTARRFFMRSAMGLHSIGDDRAA